MSWKNDSQDCLLAAEDMLSELSDILRDMPEDQIITPQVRIKIKNILDNCRAPLDYIANDIFNSFCKKNYNKKELDRIRIYFPIKDTKPKFKSLIEKNFKGLYSKREDIVAAIEIVQPFNDNLLECKNPEIYWLKILNDLTNENKHHKLSRNTKVKTTTFNGDFLGNSFNNFIIHGSGTHFSIDGSEHNFGESSFLEKYFNYKNEFNLYFQDLDVAVIPTLTNILVNTKKTINSFDKLLDL